MRSHGRRLIAGLLASLLAVGLVACEPRTTAADKKAPDPAALVKPSYERALNDANAAVAEGEAATKGPIESALIPLELVAIYTERARLTGSYDDYQRAEDLLGRMEPNFKGADGLCLAKAKLHYSLHRLAAAKRTLAACPGVANSPEGVMMQADIAFYTGDYSNAGTIYRLAVNQAGTPQAYIRLALYASKMGAPGEALAFMEAAEQRYHGGSPLQESWFALQRGIIELERGRYDEARALFALADERLPGYWLNEEHLAEVASLTGDAAGERRILEAVVRKTTAPEYLDWMAGIEAKAGNQPAANQLLARAEAIYAERAKRFPEAIAGHALDHYLDAAPQPAKALALAQANFQNRPHGDAAVALANAYLLNDRAGDAARLLEREIAKGWNTAEAWWVLAEASEAAGNAARAKTARAEALRRNPNSAKQY